MREVQRGAAPFAPCTCDMERSAMSQVLWGYFRHESKNKYGKEKSKWLQKRFPIVKEKGA